MAFIVLEGLDGAGKSTQIELLRRWLQERGGEVEYVHFPRYENGVFGDLIARFLRGDLGALDEVNPYLVALIYACDRADAADGLRKALADGKHLVADRYVYSNIGYQCAKLPHKERKELRNWIFDLEFGHNKLPRPDVNIFLDVPFAFTESRLAAAREGGDRDYLQGARDIHEESLELQKNVREVYLDAVCEDPTLQIVDCSDGNGRMASPEENFRKIQKIITDVCNS